MTNIRRRGVVASQLSLLSLMLISSVSAANESLFVAGNLILINPLQSLAIFAAILVMSVLVEAATKRVRRIENKHLRLTLRYFKEHIMILGFAELGLLTVNFGLSSLSAITTTQFSMVSMILLYMTLCNGVVGAAIALVMQANAKQWRTFEWGRMEARVTHSSLEQIFVSSRRVFVELLHNVVATQKKVIREIPPIAFSVFLSRIEKLYLRNIFRISFVSWGGLGAVIIVNMARMLIVGTSSTATEVHSFIGVIGYGTMVVFLICSYTVQWRLRGILDTLLDIKGDQDGGVKGSAEANRKRAAVGANGTSPALLLGSVNATLQTFQLLHLIMMWYTSMYIVMVAELSYDTHGWFAWLVGVEALLPVVVFYARFPGAVFITITCVALGRHVDLDAVAGLQRGVIDQDHNNQVSSDEDREEAFERRAREAGASTRLDAVRIRNNTLMEAAFDADDHKICDDEVASPSNVTLHDSAPPDQVPPGEPTRMMGVPPASTLARKFNTKPLDPVFL